MSVYDIPGHEIWARAITNATVDATTDSSSSSSSSSSSFSFNNTYNVAFFNQFAFSAAKSTRSSVMILAAFNMVAAFTTVVGILLDSWMRTRRRNPHFNFGRHGFTFVSLPEMFPLVLSVGIVVQGSVFVVAQSLGLRGISVLGCTVTSQMMFPAVFIVPYLQLVFSLNTAWISMQSTPFLRRGKWNVSICLSIASFLLFVKYLVALFVRPPNFCFASLYWFVLRWGLACFIITMVIVVTLIATAIVIFLKLRSVDGTNNIAIDSEERAAAATMLYYILIAMLSNFLLIPFFFSIGIQGSRFFNSTALQLSLVSSIVSNVSGILTGGLHLYLRSRIIAKIPAASLPGPTDIKYSPEKHDSFKRHIRVHTNDSDASSTSTTIAAPAGSHFNYEYNSISKPPPTAGLKQSPSSDYLLHQAQSPLASSRNAFDPLRSNSIYNVMSDLPQEPEPVKIYSPEMSPPLKNYSPTSSSDPANSPRESSSLLLPTTTTTTTYDPLPSTAYGRHSSSSTFIRNSAVISTARQVPLTMSIPISMASTTSRGDSIALLAPPRYGNTTGKPSHIRNSSLGSSATVQIGLRISNADDVRLNSGYFQDQDKVYSISYEASGAQPPFPPTNFTSGNGNAFTKKSSPLATNNTLTVPSPTASTTSQSPTSPSISARDDDEYSSRYCSTISGVTGFSGFSRMPSFDVDELAPIPIQLVLGSPNVAPLKLTTLNAAVYDASQGQGRRRSKSVGDSQIEIGILASPRMAEAQKGWN